MKLPADEVHVWRVELDIGAELLHMAGAVLAADELAVAARYVQEVHRRRYVAARAALRMILSAYLSLTPEHLRFHYNAFGKPALPTRHDGRTLEFNLSHTGHVALYAVAWDRSVGIDVEAIRPEAMTDAVMEQVFSAEEARAWRMLPSHRQLEAFYQCWTHKEAIVKARGDGLSFPLEQLTVTITPGVPPAVLRLSDGSGFSQCWSLTSLDLGPGYVAALAVAGAGCTLTMQSWSWMDHALGQRSSGCTL